jgi:ABC-type thiamine transport system ATPase subunit
MELRCLVSSGGSSQLFDLRCVVREKMIEFLRDNFPSALPTFRMEMRGTTIDPNALSGIESDSAISRK